MTTNPTSKTNPPDPTGAPYTVPEAAALLRVSPATVRTWIAQGTICAIQPGRAYLIPRPEVHRLITPAAAR